MFTHEQNKNHYIACLDVGTTTVRCHIINGKGDVLGKSNFNIDLLYPQSGFVEIDPNDLWVLVTQSISSAIKDSNLTVHDIDCLGISTQRSTFITWKKDTGEYFHNFITWKDIRASELCKKLNGSMKINVVRWLAYLVYLCTRSGRYLIGSRLKIAPYHVTGRLLWILDHIPNLRREIERNNVMFGTVETWLIYKFSNHELHISDITNASATALFDPYLLEWGSWLKSVLNIPLNILPQVVANDSNFGVVHEKYFGRSIPIKCIMGDQSCSLLASGCTNTDDLKITLGTGAFLNVNSGSEIHTSLSGLYPLIGWKITETIDFIVEGACYDCGSLIVWMLNAGLLKDAALSSDVAASVPDSDGVYFIPAFSGLGPPINDSEAASGFLGVKPTTTKAHLVRAVLESIVYRIVFCYKILKKERNKTYNRAVVDGGVSRNDFICQLLADLMHMTINRMKTSEVSALGAGFLAGLSFGIWNNLDDIKTINPPSETFYPSEDVAHIQKCNADLNKWLKATKRFINWYC